MSFETKFESILPDIPQELRPQFDPRRTALDALENVSSHRSRALTITGTQVPTKLREVIQLAGTQLSDFDEVNMSLLHRRAHFPTYRFEIGWPNSYSRSNS